MDLMKGIEESRERKEKKKERKVEQRENNKRLAKMIAKELKYLIPDSDDSRIATIEKRLTELENLVRTFLARDEAEDLQESSTPVHDTADATQIEREEEYPGLQLKKQKYKGEIINLNIEAIRHKSRNDVWYKVTGEYADGGGPVLFTPFDPNVYRFPGSVGIQEGKNHKKIVQLLCDAGIITGEETGRYTTLFSFDGLGEDYICYRLTDQAIEYTNQNQKEKYPGLKLKNHEWRGREINLYIEAKRPYPNENPWYDITGYYTCGGEEVQFSQYTFDFYRYHDSAAIDMWKDHDKIVRLLYNAGIITKEKTYTSIGLEKKCICYRLTDQALAYAHREQ